MSRASLMKPQANRKLIGAAVIGLGIGRQHLIGFDRYEKSQAVLGCDISPQKLGELQDEYPNVEYTDRWQDILERADIDLVSVATFDDVHCEQVCALLSAGKHVFVEKPVCLSRDELDQINQAWTTSGGLWLTSNLVLRAAPVYRWLRQSIQDGLFGDIYAIDGDYLYGRLHKITDGWRSDVKGYSVMLGGGIHMADLMVWVTGQRPGSVQAIGNRICTQDSSFRYLDFTSATYQFPSGMIGRINANFGCVHRHQHVLRVFGTKATFIYDDQGPRLIQTRDPEVPVEMLDLNPLPLNKWDLIPEMIDGIAAGEDPTPRVKHEFDVMSLCLAADQSVEQKSNIEIEYV